jgi:hypothetical protein
MENVRNNDSNEGRNATTADSSGIAIANGSNIRPNDRSQSSITGKNVINGTEGFRTGDNVTTSVGRNQSVEITDGFYFTPRGTIERIPSGHYISDSGKLRKRRVKRSDSSNANGNENRNRTETGEYSEESTSKDFLLEKPLNVRGSRKRKTAKQETTKLTMVTMLASGAAAIFTSISLLTKHDHWNLQTDEGKILAEALNEAINTLPEKYYAQVTGIVEKWIPWINLCFVCGAIIVPRIEASAKRIEKRYTPKSEGSDKRDTTTTDNPFGSYSSIGFDN